MDYESKQLEDYTKRLQLQLKLTALMMREYAITKIKAVYLQPDEPTLLIEYVDGAPEQLTISKNEIAKLHRPLRSQYTQRRNERNQEIKDRLEANLKKGFGRPARRPRVGEFSEKDS